MIHNYFDLTAAFNLEPAEAIEYFQGKGLTPTFSYLDLVGEEHDAAFTVAKMMDIDLLGTVKGKLDDALANGETLADFKRTLVPQLQKAGWWGKKDLIDPLTGQVVESQLGSATRLETIFRTNMQSAYAVGHWEKIEANAQDAPYLLYDAVDDAATRPEHAQWDGTLLPVGSPFWDTHYPLNGYNCRCGVIQVDEDELAEYGMTPSAEPRLEKQLWTNPRTGATMTVPKGVDPQFAHNAGKARMEKLKALEAEKAAALAAEEAQALANAQAGMEKAKTAGRIQAQANKALKELQEAQTAGAFATHKAKFDQRAAQHQIDKAIAEKTPYLAVQIKNLAKTKAGQKMAPLELLEKAKEKAVLEKQSVDLISYKNAALAGKEPKPSALAAYQALPADKKQALDQEIEVKTGNYQAKLQLEEYKTGSGYSYEKKALKKLSNQGALDGLEPKAQIKAIEQAAAAQKLKDQQAKAIKGYEKNVIAGKTPTDNQLAAVKTLTGPELSKFMSGIKAAKQAAQDQAQLDAIKTAGQGLPDTHPVAIGVKAAEEMDGPPGLKLKAAEEAIQKAQSKPEAPAMPKAQPEAPAPVAKAPESEGPNMDTLTQIGPQEGTNPGASYLDETTGIEWYIKNPGDMDNAKNEVLTGKLYKLAGVEGPEMEVVTRNGKPGIASKKIPGLTIEEGLLKAGKVANVNENLAIDAWLANWDVIGFGYDNLKVGAGRAVRLDTGGGLRYRAQGELKGDKFGETVTELETLRDPGLNRQAASVFRHATEDDIRAGVAKLAKIDDQDIDLLVAKYGPESDTERAKLAKTLKARRDNLLERYGMAKPEPVPDGPAIPPATITKGELERIKAARVNGLSIEADLDAIEDHSVRLAHYTGKDGQPFTRVTLNLREPAMQKLATQVGGQTPAIQMGTLRTLIGDTMRGLGSRNAKGEPFDATISDRLQRAINETTSTIAKLEDQLDGIVDQDEAHRAWTWLKAALEEMQGMKALKVGDTVPALSRFWDVSELPVSLHLKASDKALLSVEEGVTANKSRHDRSRISLTNESLDIVGGKAWTANIDGADVRIFAPGKDRARYIHGHTFIDVPGQDTDAASKAMAALEKLGISMERTMPQDREALYVQQMGFARYAYLNPARWDQFNNATSTAAKIKILNDDAGFDITKTETWKEGKRELTDVFQHGKKHFLRADLDEKQLKKFAKDYTIYSNINGLSKGGLRERGAAEQVKIILEGGGTLIPLKERIRRGLPGTNQAQGRDYREGGAESVFTRLKDRTNPSKTWSTNDTGLYFNPERLLRRVDRVSYDHDEFGSREPGYLKDRAKDTADLRRFAKQSGDETFFKDGLSLFTGDLEKIVVYDQKERLDLINWAKDRGYSIWPDGTGRAIEDIIKAKT